RGALDRETRQKEGAEPSGEACRSESGRPGLRAEVTDSSTVAPKRIERPGSTGLGRRARARALARFHVLLARVGDLVVVVATLLVFRAPLDQLVLEQGLEGLVLGFLLGPVAGLIGVAGDPLEHLLLRLAQLGPGGLLGRRL